MDLFGAPGEVCGACDLGVNRCAGANRLECSQGDEPPEGWCGCSGPYIENAPCGTCGSGQVACRDGQLSCDGDAGPEGRNACGGCGDLPAEPGGTCGTCLAWACGSSGVLRCEPDSSLEGCGSVVSCDELDPPCEELVRSCIESDGEVGARCGDCRRGFVEVDGACVEEGPAPVTCAALAAECAEEGRNCVEGGDGEDARCGGCLEGYVSEGGGCRLLLTCAALDCSGQNRACDERGELEDAVCGDCLPGFEGSGDACVMPPLECERDEDCASGLQCRSGTCVTAEPQCTDVADCDPGEVCVFGQCELEPDCMVDDDCGLDERCTGQQCECTGQGTRSLGQACTSSTQCCSGVCFGAAGMGTCSRPCQAMSDCQEPGMAVHLICGSLPGLGQYCAPADFGSPCNEPGQCSGGICMDRFIGGTTPDRACTWACTQSSDCPSGATCGQLATNTGFILACIPVGEVCEGGNNGLDCFSGLCLDSTNPDLPAVCTSECRPEQELPCGQGWECVLIDPAFPPVCIPPGY